MADVILASEARKRTEAAFHTISDELAVKLNALIKEAADNGRTNTTYYGQYPPTLVQYLMNKGYSAKSSWDDSKQKHKVYINWKE